MRRLQRTDLSPDPIRQFAKWYRAAAKDGRILQPDACCLTTLGLDGYPAGRMVLLKSCDTRGFVFYTNFSSPKGRSLLAYPKAGLTFYWEPQERQVRVVGEVEAVSSAEADDYFHTRPRLSQIGAWASHQSEALRSRGELDRRFADYREKFRGESVPRPPHWGGFRVVPREIEFWQSRPNRLHDRFLYSRRGTAWRISRLNP